MDIDEYYKLRDERPDLRFPEWEWLSPESKQIVFRTHPERLIARRTAVLLCRENPLIEDTLSQWMAKSFEFGTLEHDPRV